jgi:hypothetical protein
MPTIAGDAARIPLTDEAVLALVRQHFDGIEAMYLCPTVPGKKELAARSIHARHLPSDERVLALFDDTVFGLGDDGFLVTARRLCWKNVGGRAQMIEWQHVDPDRMYRDRKQLVLGSGAIQVSGDEAVLDACEEVFHVLAFSARETAGAGSVPVAGSGVVLAGASNTNETNETNERESARPTFRPSRPAAVSHATRPPPHAVSYDSYVVHASSQKSPKFSCWQCQTPLHWSTPQCAYCSAWPMPQGWLRTA